MKLLLSTSFCLFAYLSLSQIKDSTNQQLSLLFIGDIMGHGPQITSAYNSETKSYDYNSCFKYITEEISDADYSIANLEVTLAGPPYKGYPQFSSPDELAIACKNSGIDVLVTSNNHSCDRGGQGIKRTINVLDSLNIMQTGTFLDSTDRNSRYPLIIESDCLRIAILNYTYGTNGIPYPAPTIVNMIDEKLMKKDLEIAKSQNVDKIIVVTHWGSEYQLQPNNYQIENGQFLFDNGADIIIGSHPHVLEKMVWEKSTNIKGREQLIVYSLGNFVSNQRKRYTDGGSMFKMTFEKNGDRTFIKNCGYMLTWVYTPIENGKKQYYILPASKYENDIEFFNNKEDYTKMKTFIKDSRTLLNTENINVPEFIYKANNWTLE